MKRAPELVGDPPFPILAELPEDVLEERIERGRFNAAELDKAIHNQFELTPPDAHLVVR